MGIKKTTRILSKLSDFWMVVEACLGCGDVRDGADGLLWYPNFFARCSLRRISSGLTLSICAARCLRKRKCLPSRFGRLPPPLAALPCGPLPLLFARFICRWQRSQTSPSGYSPFGLITRDMGASLRP